MKVQKVIKAQGEWVKLGTDIKDGDIIKILDEGQVISGTYGDQNVFKIETKNGEKNLGMNQTSMNHLIDGFGDDTVGWKGKEVKVWLVRQSVSGSLKNVCYLTPPDWEVGEDKRGNLKFTAPGKSDEEEIDPADIPF